MRIKCANPEDGDVFSRITIGKEYDVLAIEFYSATASLSKKDFVLYRIIDDEQMVMPYPALYFEIVSGDIPSSCIAYRDRDNSYNIMPRTWTYESFWEDLYDDDNKAKEEFKKEMEHLIPLADVGFGNIMKS